ncbi:MAG: hypothetical protein V4629_09580 [Pseudomonadota bacterium]
MSLFNVNIHQEKASNLLSTLQSFFSRKSKKSVLNLLESHDPADPSPWLALELDQENIIVPEVKRAWVKDASSKFRQYVLPILRPFLRVEMATIQVYRSIFPNAFTSSKLLHQLLVLAMKNFVTPEGNYLVLRHFHLGTQSLDFLRDNIANVKIKTKPLLPENLDDLKDEMFLKHDINLYNFIIDLNIELKEKAIPLIANTFLNYSAISQPNIKVNDFKRGLFNAVDLESAIEIFTPIFQLLLSDRVFWRSVHSLQFDETIGLYYANILDAKDRLYLINNKHPMLPVITSETARRLVLHGLSTEALHGILVMYKYNRKRELIKNEIAINH